MNFNRSLGASGTHVMKRVRPLLRSDLNRSLGASGTVCHFVTRLRLPGFQPFIGCIWNGEGGLEDRLRRVISTVHWVHLELGDALGDAREVRISTVHWVHLERSQRRASRRRARISTVHWVHLEPSRSTSRTIRRPNFNRSLGASGTVGSPVDGRFRSYFNRSLGASGTTSCVAGTGLQASAHTNRIPSTSDIQLPLGGSTEIIYGYIVLDTS